MARRGAVRLSTRRRGAGRATRIPRSSGAPRRPFVRRLLALTLARERPGAVRSLAVYDPVAFGVLHASQDEAGLIDLERVRSNPVFLDDAHGGSEAWFEVFVDYWNGLGTWRALPEGTRASFLKTGRRVYLEARSLLEERTPADAYRPITAPTLLLGGARSPVAARRVLALLAAAIPRVA